MFGINKKEDEPKIVSVEKYKILGHSICWGVGNYSSVVAVRNEKGQLLHFELTEGDEGEISEDVIEIKGAFVEVTNYSDDNYTTKVTN